MSKARRQQDQPANRRETVGVCILLTLLTWLVFGQTFAHDFVNFDDDRYVYENAQVSRGLTLQGFKWVLTHSHASLWHPLTTLSHMFDCQLYGLHPGGHHLTNVVLHNIGAILLFLVLREMTTNRDSRRNESGHSGEGNDNLWRSAFVAAIFAIHPMRVESVAWIAERKDVLSGVFFMLTLGAYVKYGRAPSLWRYVGMSILFACGLLSKATLVTMPVLLLLLDYWPLRRTLASGVWWRLILEKIPLFALSAGLSVVTTLAQSVTMPSLEQLPFLPRLKNAAVSVIIYIKQMIWPSDLAVFYPHPHNQLNNWVALSCTALICGATLVAILARRRAPYIFLGWFWYLVLLFPVLGFFQAGLQARADRFVYLPHIGISIVLTWTIADLTSAWRNQRLILTTTAATIITSLMFCAWWQTIYWRDSISLWTHTLAVTSMNQTAHQDLAAALWARGRKEEATVHTRAAGIVHWQTVLKDYPFDVLAHDNLGVLLIQSGDVTGALREWEASLDIDSHDGNAENNLAWVFATYPDKAIRDGRRAVELAEKAVSLPGGNAPMILRTLAAAYAEQGEFPKAIETAQRALELATMQNKPSLAKTMRNEIELYRAESPYREMPTR